MGKITPRIKTLLVLITFLGFSNLILSETNFNLNKIVFNDLIRINEEPVPVVNSNTKERDAKAFPVLTFKTTGIKSSYKSTANSVITVEEITPSTCSNKQDGGISISVTGASPFTYSWSSGQTTQDISNISPGKYIVTVTDSAGEITTSSEIEVLAEDIVDPTASNPAPVNVQCIADVPVQDPLVVTDEADNCTSSPTVAFVSDVSDNNSNPEVITRTYSVTDDAGNAINVIQTITVNDTTDPTASNPAPVNVQCLADVPVQDPLVVTDEADNCTSSPTVAFVSDVSDNNSNPEVITRTYSVTDDAGNAINVIQTITVNDTTDPTASNPAPVNVQCLADVPVQDPLVVTDEADNCTSNSTVAFVSDSSDNNSNPEVITRTYSVTDDAGNAINVFQTITVNDTTEPTATNPAPVNVQCVADVPTPDPSVVTDEADNCTSNPTVAFVSDLSDNNSNPEVITRTYSVTDDAGNAINVIQTITVNDTTEPTANNPAPVNVQCLADVPAPDPSVVTDEADNCTSGPTVAFVYDSNDNNSNPEIITRTYSVTDDAGNAINVIQTITVNDTTEPTASNPAPVNVQCLADVPSPDPLVVTDEADNCTSSPAVAFVSDLSDNNSTPEVITRTYSVTDDAGNAINVIQTISINDTTDPTASNPAPVNVQCLADVPTPDPSVVTDEADKCTSSPTVVFVSDVSDNNSNPEVITRTYSVTDDAGNAINVIQTITVNDTTDPTANNPAPVNVQCLADVPAPDPSVVTDEADNCTSSPTVAFVSDSSDNNSNPEVITRTYSVTDDAGNVINVFQTITVNDTTEPTATNPAPVNVQCLADVPVQDPLVVTDEADNCTSSPTVAFVSDSSDNNSNPEVITRTYSVTDDAGNAINVIQTITVNDTTKPLSLVLPDLVSECPITVTPPITNDNCDGTIAGTTGITDLTFDASGSIYWIFKDAAGNETEPIEQKVIINNTVAPIPDVESLPTITINGCQISNISELTVPTATDVCEGTINGSLSEDFQFPYSFYGTNTIDWEFIDSQGNKSTQTQQITLIPLSINGGKLKGTFLSTIFQNQIDISSCEEAISIELTLQEQVGTIVQWEKFAVNRAKWEAIAHNANNYTASFATGELESTYYRVLIQAGTCTEYSSSFYIRALPAGDAPTVDNLDPDNIYCLGEEVSLVAKSNYTATQAGIPDSSGDFDQGQLNTQDPDSWLVDGAPGGFTAGGNARKPRNWSGTNNHEFGGIEFDSQDKKFTIAYGNYNSNEYKGSIPTTLESPILDLSNAENASLDFDQAFYFSTNDAAEIEVSIDGGTTYKTLKVMHSPGSGIKSWYTAGTAESTAGSTATQYYFKTDNTSISLAEYLGENRVRIRWSFTGTSDQSVWAMDNIFINKEVIVETELEWTEGIGDPEENPIATGSTEVPISFVPDTPGVHDYGGTALINNCRTYGEEGTGIVSINVSSSYAGEDIIYTSEECGRNNVQLNAYDNTKTANENIAKGAFTAPASGCRKCDAPGTGDIGEWSWEGEDPSCTPVSFSDINNPDAIFTAGPGTYTLTWTVNGCSNNLIVTITDCDKVDFDGIDDFVDFNDNYDLNGAFSLEVWVKPESINGTRTVFSKRDSNFSGTAVGYDLRITDGIVSFNWDKSGIISSSPHKVSIDRWYHLALTHTASGDYRLYIDGILIKSTAGGSPGDNTNNALLGAMDNSTTSVPSNHYNGWIEEVRIWGVALNPEQIRMMMNQHIKKTDTGKVIGEILPLNIPVLDWNNLKGYYRMDAIGCGNLHPYNDGLKVVGFEGKLNNITTPQQTSAPLPYVSENNGTWKSKITWDLNTANEGLRKWWTFPNDLGINGAPILWNIAEINHNITSGGHDINVLGLISKANTLTISNPNSTQDWQNSGQALRISHYLRIDGNIVFVGESQLVQSDIKTAAQITHPLIEFPQSITSVLEELSIGYIERAQQGTANSYNYNYWSSPVSAQPGANNSTYTVKGVMMDGSSTANYGKTLSFEGWHEFADGVLSTPRKISNYWINKFRGTANVYSEWKQIGSTGELNAGEGYTMKGTSGQAAILDRQNYVFRGKPNNGTIPLNIQQNQNYLLGNPYPSAIDVNKFILDNLKAADVAGGTNSRNVFNGAVYFWDHFAGGNTHILLEYIGGYATRNLIDGVPAISNDYRVNANDAKGNKIPGRFIPVAQGFFINSVIDPEVAGNISVDGGDVLFKNSQRFFMRESSGNTGNSVFLRPEVHTKQEVEVEVDKRSKIRIDFKSPMGYYRQILVGVDANASNGFDLGYDALMNDYNVEDMYWIIGGREFVIQGVSNFGLSQVLPLGLRIAEEGEIMLKINELKNIGDEVNIFLKDKLNNTYYDLRESEAKISLTKGEIIDRFEIVFKKDKVLPEPDEETNPDETPGEGTDPNEGTDPDNGENPEVPLPPGSIDVIFAEDDHQLRILNPDEMSIQQVEIFNLLGQKIEIFTTDSNQKQMNFQVQEHPAALYVVKVFAKEGMVSKNILIMK